jgi:TRAP-type C4-dicarboxylate transport system substrate-binding protein
MGISRRLACVLVLAAGVRVGQAGHAAGPLRLKFAIPFPIGHPSYLLARHYINELQRQAGNRLQVEFFPARQLGSARDMLSVCGSGKADLCQVHITVFAAQLPYSNLVVLPYWNTSAEGSSIYQTLIETSPEILDEFRAHGVRPLMGTTTPAYEVATVHKPVQTLDDLKGLELKTAGGLFDSIARYYGIVPVGIAPADTYDAVRSGRVEGVVFNYPSIRSYQLDDQIRFITSGMRAGGYPGTLIINEATWNRLPAEIREILRRVSRQTMQWQAQRWDEMQQEALVQFREKGIQVYELSGSQRMAWNKALDGLGEEYVSEMEKRGFTKIRKVHDDYRNIAERIAK